MSLFEWFGRKRGDGRRRAAEVQELAGDLAAAVELYLVAQLPDDAARVLLLRADVEQAPEKRLAFCAAASRTAESAELKRVALVRKALLSFDLLRAREASIMRSEVLAVARELEAVGELERAADAYVLADDTDSELRVLAAAGSIERLEDRFRASMTVDRDQRELTALLRKIADLDRTAERREALAMADAWLAVRNDERVAEAARALRARVLAGPMIEIEAAGEVVRYALGAEITIGRGEATIVVASRAVSRVHVRIRRGPSGVQVEDLATRNGTTLAGARLAGPLPVGDGVRVLLGGEVPCMIAPRTAPGGCMVEIAGDRFLAPLSDLEIGPWRIRAEQSAAGAFVVLKTPAGAPPPFLGGYQLAPSIELCAGDEIAASRGGPVAFRLVGGSRAALVEVAPGLGSAAGCGRE